MKTIDEATRQSIIMSRAAGHSYKDLALMYSRPASTISRICRAAAQLTEQASRTTAANFREKHRDKAIQAVDRGLTPRDEDDAKDDVNRARLAVNVLQGLGIYRGPSDADVKLTMVHRFEDLPPDWRDRYISQVDRPPDMPKLKGDPILELEAKEIKNDEGK